MNRNILVALAIAAFLCASALGDPCLNEAEGYTFVAADGCNNCVCAGGNAVCTEMGCGNPPEDDRVICTDGSQTVYATPFETYCNPTENNSDPAGQTQVAVGCTDQTACIEMVTFAWNAIGQKYVFPNGCLPEGFKPFDGVCEGQVSCTASQETVSATPFDQSCVSNYAQPAPVGCIDAGLICPQVITYATDAAGTLFVFSNGCIPDGFRQTDAIPTCEDITGCPAQSRPSHAMLATNFCSMGIQAENEIVGCIESNLMCASMPLFAASPKGILYYFPYGCIPLGFTVVPADCSDILAAESCPANSRVVTASPFHSFCSGAENAPSIGVGCVESDAMCTQEVTFAKNTNGNIFVFSSGCIPESFTRVDEACPGVCDAGFKPMTAIDASAHCWGAAPGVPVTESIVGCIEEDVICTTVETFARERGTGAISIFPTSCLPLNYESIPQITGCHDLICLDADCASYNRVCQSVQVECFTTPCPPIARCVDAACADQAVYDQFDGDCGAICSCDEYGNLTCSECAKEPSSDNDDKSSTVVIAAGSVGVAAASAAAFVGYRKYFRKTDALSLDPKSTYATMEESA